MEFVYIMKLISESFRIARSLFLNFKCQIIAQNPVPGSSFLTI